MTTVGDYKIKLSLTKNTPAMEKTITSLSSGDNKTNGKKKEAFTKFSHNLNKELLTRNMEVIGTFDARHRIGGSATLYPPSHKQHSPVIIDEHLQQWEIECDYNTRTGKIWLMASCPFMQMVIMASREAFTECLLDVTRVEPIVKVDKNVCYGMGNMLKIEFDRKNIDDKYLVEIFADLLSCLDMKMKEINFTSGDLTKLDVVEKRITIISNK